MANGQFHELDFQIQSAVDYSKSKRISDTWGKLTMMDKDSDAFKSLPVVAKIDHPGFENQPIVTSEEPVTIPLVGGGRLEIGRQQMHYDYKGKPEISETIVLGITSDSHRTSEIGTGKMFTAKVVVAGYGDPDITLFQQNGKYMDANDTNALNEAKRWLALFKPEKDIDWNALQRPSSQQKFILAQSGFQPSKT